MLATSITGFNQTNIPAVLAEKFEAKETIPASRKIDAERKITVEEYVKAYFSDIPIMVEIAKCESRFRHYDENGNVLRGEVNSLDRGVMQINEYYHKGDSDKLGYDILTLEGNAAYARHIYEKYGVRPWKSSMPCWGRSAAYSEYKDLAVNK
jgi:hypothetical protein